MEHGAEGPEVGGGPISLMSSSLIDRGSLRRGAGCAIDAVERSLAALRVSPEQRPLVAQLDGDDAPHNRQRARGVGCGGKLRPPGEDIPVRHPGHHACEVSTAREERDRDAVVQRGVERLRRDLNVSVEREPRGLREPDGSEELLRLRPVPLNTLIPPLRPSLGLACIAAWELIMPWDRLPRPTATARYIGAGNRLRPQGRPQGLNRLPAISIGLHQACGLDQHSHLWCWGNNSAGEVGDGTINEVDQPTLIP
jgi:hypothetical protein